MDLKKLKTSQASVGLTPNAGAPLWECLDEALALSAALHIDVILIHNGHRYLFDSRAREAASAMAEKSGNE